MTKVICPLNAWLGRVVARYLTNHEQGTHRRASAVHGCFHGNDEGGSNGRRSSGSVEEYQLKRMLLGNPSANRAGRPSSHRPSTGGHPRRCLGRSEPTR